MLLKPTEYASATVTCTQTKVNIMYKYLLPMVIASATCFGSECFFDPNAHIPLSGNESDTIHFCTTRSLDNGALKSSILMQLKKLFAIDVFIEIGTYLGDTTARAAEVFNEVHTIELAQELYIKAIERFHNWKNVSVYLGSSELVFQYLLSNIHKRTLFYLDGHYSGHGTARGSFDTPVLKELQAIEHAKKIDSVILIDDIRLFQPSCFPEKFLTVNMGLETYPDLKEIVAVLLRINPNYHICFLGDALLAFPNQDGIYVSPVVRACALHRLAYLCPNLSDEELKNAARIIGHAEPNEMEEIAIYYHTYAPFELDFGYRSYACLWHALILKEVGDKEQAISLLKKAAENSLPDWRACQCID